MERKINAAEMKALMTAGGWQQLAQRAVKIKSGRSLLFSFEKIEAVPDIVNRSRAS